MTRTLRALSLLLVLFLPVHGWAAITFNESQTNAADEPGITTHALPAANVAANSLVVACFKWENNVTLNSMTGGDTLTLLTSQSHTSNLAHGRCGYVLAASANASYVITATYSANVEYVRAAIYEFTYTGTASFDVQIGSTEDDFDETPSSDDLTTTGTDEVCIALHSDGQGQTFSGQTINGVALDGGAVQSDMASFYKIFTGTFTGASSLTRTSFSPSRWIQRLSCFKATAGGGPTGPPVGTLSLMGVGR